MLAARASRFAEAVDELVFASLVAPEHSLRKVATAVDFETLRPLVADCYSQERGRPAPPPPGGPDRLVGERESIGDRRKEWPQETQKHATIN